MSRLLGWSGFACIAAMLPATAFAQTPNAPGTSGPDTSAQDAADQEIIIQGVSRPITSGPANDADSNEPMTAERASDTARRFFSVAEEEEPDPCANANADPDIIVVCRQFEDGEQYMFERPTRADEEVTGSGAPRARDPGGLMPDCESQSVCMGGLGSKPPPALMVDFESLPETPAGSDAARYGGPTVGARSDIVGVTPPREEEGQTRNIGLETQRGIEDETYGP